MPRRFTSALSPPVVGLYFLEARLVRFKLFLCQTAKIDERCLRDEDERGPL